MLHTLSLSGLFEGAALMGGDMVGLVAFDFVLGIVFRGVVSMAFVGKILGVDGDDSARHQARLGIPSYMIADLKRLFHCVVLIPSSAQPERPKPIDKDMYGATTRVLIGDSLNRRGIAVFRYIGFDLIADCHAIHLRMIVDADTGHFAVGILDGHMPRSDILDPFRDRILFDPLSRGG